MGKKLCVANWKMNLTADETVSYANEFNLAMKDLDLSKVDVIIFPATCLINILYSAIGGTAAVGAQLISAYGSGAFTGQNSARQVVSCGASWAFVGTSEVRQYLNGNKSEDLREQISQAIENNMRVIYFIGEMMADRESGEWKNVLKSQLETVLFGFGSDDVSKVSIAYEPVFAIGTGMSITVDQAEETCAYIRSVISDKYGKDIADNIRVCFAGSVKPANSLEIFAQPDIDGVVVGGASLKVNDFAAIIEISQ